MKYLLLLSCIVFCINIRAQERIYLSYFEAHNMNKNFQVSATRIFRAYLLQGRKYFSEPLTFVKDTIAAPESYQQAWDHAKALGVNYFVKGEMDRLGETVIVNVTLHKTLDGTAVWTDMLKASSPEDLDPILEKLAKSMGSPPKAAGELADNTLSNYESRMRKQEISHTYLGIAIGGAVINSRVASQSLPAGFGLIISHDTRKYIADIAGEVYFGAKSLYFLNLAVSALLLSKPNTPYIQGGLAVGASQVQEKEVAYVFHGPPYMRTVTHTGGGLMLNAGAGYLFSRNSNVRIRAGAKFMLPLFRINDLLPFGGVFNLEIGFGR